MRIFRVLCHLAAVFLCAVALRAASQTRVLHEVSFTGAPAYTQAELQSFTGLKPGSTATQQQIQEAAQRLGDTGVFEQVNFSGNDKGVVFTLTPAPPSSLLRAHFRNFVWWQDDEIDRTLKTQIPLYRGDAIPATGTLADSVVAALKAMVAEKGLAGASVGSIPGPSRQGGPVDSLNFAIDSPPVVIHSLTLSGASPAMQPKLDRVIRDVKGGPWDATDSYTDIASRVGDVYHNEGYLDIALPTQQHAPPAVTPDEVDLDLTATLIEGVQYHVSQLAWPGSEVLSSADFARLAKLKPGDPDSPSALRESLSLVTAAYGAKGYIDAKALAPSVIDRSAHQVAYTVSVVPGQQYRFKAVHWPTLSTEQAQAFDTAWQMKPGDIYNSEYIRQFLAKSNALLKQGFNVNIALKRDPADLTVDLSVSFTRGK